LLILRRVDLRRSLHGEADLLHHEIAGEAICGFDDNRADAVARDARQQGGEARARLDRIGAAYRRVVKLLDNVVAVRPGECLDRCALALVAVLLGADAAGRWSKENNPRI
jgi:hypothetical protein